MGIDFAKELNEEQYEAATGPDGPVLVLAAAGTGKTRTLVYRVAHLIERGVSPAQILLLTFTNRAAREMLERAQQVAGPGVGGVWGGTFHHFANRLLRRHAKVVGYNSDYAILDRDESRTIVSDCTKALGLQSKEFPKAAVLLSLHSSAVNAERPVEEVIEERFSEYWGDTSDIVRVLKAYEDKKRALGAMDFDDLLINCLGLLRESEAVRERYQEQFDHVLVDEYQDTNPIQAELVDRIGKKNGNVLVVGDDFQSIYSWRGADFKNIMSFPDRYPGSRMVKLETNYRSVPEILEVANACIAKNPEQFQKTLRSTREAYKKPAAAKVRDGEEQARYVVSRMRELRRDGYKLSDMAVLYRAHYHAVELEMELKREDIPYYMTSGVRFFEQAHIKDVASVLRILVSAHDEMAFTRLVRFLPGVGEKSAAKFWGKLGGRFDAVSVQGRLRLREILPPAARNMWDKIDPVLAAYTEEDLSDDPGEIIFKFLASFYEKHAVNAYENVEKRLDDIRELALYTAKFDGLEAFLSEVALLTNLDSETEEIQASNEDAIRLSTVHQAKGLEWSVVFVLWLTDGMFPSGRTLREGLGGESEERRLFYVAVTRAKDELFLCSPEVRRQRDGGVLYQEPSRFVEEIPSGLVKSEYPGFI